MLNAEKVIQKLFAHPAIDQAPSPWDLKDSPLLNRLYACGTTSAGLEVHDHTVNSPAGRVAKHRLGKSPTGKWVYVDNFEYKHYDPKIHGDITKWFDEGDEVPNSVKPEFIAIHNHGSDKSSKGAVEYKTLPRKS